MTSKSKGQYVVWIKYDMEIVCALRLHHLMTLDSRLKFSVIEPMADQEQLPPTFATTYKWKAF